MREDQYTLEKTDVHYCTCGAMDERPSRISWHRSCRGLLSPAWPKRLVSTSACLARPNNAIAPVCILILSHNQKRCTASCRILPNPLRPVTPMAALELHKLPKGSPRTQMSWSRLYPQSYAASLDQGCELRLAGRQNYGGLGGGPRGAAFIVYSSLDQPFAHLCSTT